MLFGLFKREFREALIAEAGVTLTELLVGMTLFGVVGGTLAVAMTSTLKTLGREYRLASATEGVRLAVDVISSEMKMAAHASPYVVGVDASLSNCTSTIDVTPYRVTFLVSQDDPAAANGLKSYKVGYGYDSTSQTLYRGVIDGTTVTECLAPGGDPHGALVRSPIAEKVIPVDYDGDGTVDPVFERDITKLTITVGIQVKNDTDTYVTQKIRSVVDIRNSEATT
ncbi:MAG: hypothetical protein IT290_10595 [Deltaproteobacteria bacterium]|nr:hypothetical protein [Deltaproteobacteria bacterium]